MVSQNKRSIKVELTDNSYEIIVGGLGIKSIGRELISLGIKPKTKILLITNEIINDNYGKDLISSIKSILRSNTGKL